VKRTGLSDGDFEGEECRRLVKMTKWRSESPFIALKRGLELSASIKRRWESKGNASETRTLHVLGKARVFAANTWRYLRT
jgi:hypothetical protein